MTSTSYAHREDAPRHRKYRDWLEETIHGSEPVGAVDLVLSGFLRVVTHPRVFQRPSPLGRALAFVESFRGAPAVVPVAPGDRHWSIFVRMCREADVKGNLVPYAFLAALAVEWGAEWITTDRGYGRFPKLRWRDAAGIRGVTGRGRREVAERLGVSEGIDGECLSFPAVVDRITSGRDFPFRRWRP